MNNVLKITLLNIFMVLGSAAYAVDPDAPVGDAATGATDAASQGAELQSLYDSYSKFNFGSAINWSDCLDYDLKPGIAMCPPKGFPPLPYPTPTLKFTHGDVIAMVEVVPDAWRSFLYKESFYNFENKAETSLATSLGVTPGIGGGYSNTRNSSTEFQGQNKLETHVWSVSDFSRFQSSGPSSHQCLSLTCKNEDVSGCVQLIAKTAKKLSSGMNTIVQSINGDEKAGAKGQGIVNPETGTVHYENGEVYEEQDIYDSNGNKIGSEYVQIRGEGNYGYGGLGQDAGAAMDWAMADSPFPGMSNMEAIQAGIQTVQNPSAGLATFTGAAASDAWEGSELQAEVNKEWDQFTEGAGEMWEDSGGAGAWESAKESFGFSAEPAGSTALPESTKSGAGPMPTERNSLSQGDLAGKDLSESAGAISNNATGASSNQALGGQIMGALGAAGQSVTSNAVQTVMSVIDRIQYFSVIEQFIQMVAAYTPIMVHPVYMSERHKDAAAEGGFILSPLFQKFADMGAGIMMPIFCMSKSVGMGVDGVANLVGVDIPSDILGPVSGFINGRCVGSWGPLEPRVNLLGTGDRMVAGGLAAVRGLNIAQNITGDMYNKTINNTPFNQLSFNLDWPHRSDCYSFNGFEGLSRGWTTPINSSLMDSMTGAITGDGGGGEGMANLIGKTTVGNATQQGGYVFTFWKKRKCEYLLLCDKWQGDTGL